MTAAPLFRRVCQLTGRITHPETSCAQTPPFAQERPAPDSPALAGAGHPTN